MTEYAQSDMSLRYAIMVGSHQSVLEYWHITDNCFCQWEYVNAVHRKIHLIMHFQLKIYLGSTSSMDTVVLSSVDDVPDC